MLHPVDGGDRYSKNGMGVPTARGGFTLLELVISVSAVSVLLAVLLPALSSARTASHRALCAGNQRLLGEALSDYLESNEGRFPVLYEQAAWMYGGVRFSRVNHTATLDHNRPLNRYLPASGAEPLFHCPADHGITDELGRVGTGRRSAYEAFGTSYRANTELIGPRPDTGGLGLRRDAITTGPSRLVVLGDPVWYEVRQRTGRFATWHGVPDAGNMLFLDGSVRFVRIVPEPQVGAAVFDPLAPALAFPRGR